MIQDAPVSRYAAVRSVPREHGEGDRNVSYFKIETAQAAAKLREMIDSAATAIIGPWDGEEAITLIADLDAGATGTMTGGGYPDGIRQIVDAYPPADTTGVAGYEQWLPLINYENRQCGLPPARR